jgi:multisubunit Na+/H+ antiporter MnhE subunit
MDLGFENSFTLGTLWWGFFFSVFGLYFLKEGRKKANFPLIFTGLAMLTYPYFFTNVWATLGIGLGLGFLGWFFW